MMMQSFENKTAIVTGGANGIGASIVRAFLKENVKHVSILDVNEESGKNLEEELTLQYGPEKIKFYKCDVTNDEQLFGAFDDVSEKCDGIDIVVNNAGIAHETMETYKKEIAINFTATVTSTLKALELMRVDRGGKGGTIINVSSYAALAQYSPFLFVYSATKNAVLHFSNCIGKENYYRHTNVRVITLCLGATNTDILYKSETFDDIIKEDIKNFLLETFTEDNPMQSTEIAAQGAVQSYKEGKSGSTWVVRCSKIADVTENVRRAYKIMSNV